MGPSPIGISPASPPDEGEVITGTIDGNLIINGNTVTLKGATVTGDVKMKGGKLIMKPDDSKRSKIIGSLDGKDNMRVIIFSSDVGGTIDLKNGATLDVFDGNLKTIKIKDGDDITITNSRFKSIDGLESKTERISNSDVAGDVDMKNNQNVIIDNVTIGGNLDGKNNKRITISDSEIAGNLKLKKTTEIIEWRNGSVGGDADIKDNQNVIIDAVKVRGNLDGKNNSEISVTNSIISGNLTLKNNTICSQSGNTVGGTNSGCS